MFSLLALLHSLRSAPPAVARAVHGEGGGPGGGPLLPGPAAPRRPVPGVQHPRVPRLVVVGPLAALQHHLRQRPRHAQEDRHLRQVLRPDGADGAAGLRLRHRRQASRDGSLPRTAAVPQDGGLERRPLEPGAARGPGGGAGGSQGGGGSIKEIDEKCCCCYPVLFVFNSITISV